ncbi:MAG: extracellular solute-binding protein [Chloroflexi bacterium]|nr:extracellular solute-binding protein [Chloroflexota bacterium]MBV9135366.1 extracellular solute-binding protein [Chloroflexota bacterium]MBV9898181.1 extracellular solute-binding protein [Chloroflexota bacterium]
MSSQPSVSHLASGPSGFTRRDFLRRSLVGAGLAGLAAVASAPLVVAQPIRVSQSGSLNVWHYYNTDAQVNLLGTWTQMFNKLYPNVNVVSSYVYFQDLSQKIIAAAGAKQGPDVLIYGGSDLVQMYKAGALRSMQPYWDQFADGSQYPDGVLTRFDGQIYGVKPYVNLVGWWYNKDILDDVGIQPPKTFDDVTPALAAVAAAGKNYLPLAITGRPDNQGDWTSWPWLTGYGFSYDNLDQSAAEQGFTLAAQWSSQGLVSKDAVANGQSETYDRFNVGDVAFMQNGNWNIGNAKAQFKFNYGIVEVPTPTGSATSNIFLGGEPGWMGAFGSQPDLAWAFLSQVYSKEGDLTSLMAGSIPARNDLANDPQVTSEPLLVPFANEIKTRGTEYPPKGGNVIDAQLVVAQNWSAVIAGQKDGATAAADTVAGIKALPPA